MKDGITPPIYTLHTTSGKNQEGRELSLYLYKVMIPSLFGTNQLCSNRLMQNLDDAKNDAAEFVLTQIFPQTNHQLPSLAQPLTDFNEVYSQENGTFSIQNIQSTTPGTASATMNSKTSVVSNDQTNSNGAFGGIGMISGQAGLEMPIQTAPQYILDPSGQYLMQYPTPSWQ